MSAVSPQFLETLAWTLIHFLWQGLVIGAVAAIALRGLNQHKPQTRYMVALIAFSACLLAPVMTFGLLWAQFSDLTYEMVSAENAFSGSMDAIWSRQYPAWVMVVLSNLPDILVAGWLAGVLLGGCKLLFGFLGVQWVRHHGIEPVPRRLQALFDDVCAEMNLQGRVALRVSNRILSPMTVGWIRPLVLVPASAWLGLTQDELRLIIAHEIAHIRRMDYLVNLVQQIAVTILFYHPVVHWLSRVLSEEREMCCDEMVVGESEAKRLAYAKALLHLQEQHGHMMSLVMSARGGAFLRRVYSLLTREERHHKGPQTAVNGMISLLMVGIVNTVLMLHSGDAVAKLGLGLSWQEPGQVQSLPVRNRRHPLDFVLSDVKDSWETALERQSLGPALELAAVEEVSQRMLSQQSKSASDQAKAISRNSKGSDSSGTQASGQSRQHKEKQRTPSFNFAAAQALARQALDQEYQAKKTQAAWLKDNAEVGFEAEVKPELAALTTHLTAASVASSDRSNSKVPKPRLLRMVQPHFPLSARFHSAAGDVRLVYRLYPDGTIKDIQHDGESANHPALIKAAVEALEAWEYAPFQSERPLVMAQTFRFVGKTSSRSKDICFSRIKGSCGRNLRAMDSIMINDDLEPAEIPIDGVEQLAVKTSA